MQVLSYFLMTGLILVTCASEKVPEADESLEAFVEVSSRCAYVDRVFRDDDELFQDELAQIDFPPDWEQLVDTLLVTYGGDPEFWHEVYVEISARARR